jgi:hypothetical protein
MEFESIKSITDRYSHEETTEQYLIRIGAKNNTEKKESFSRFDRDD